MAKTKTEPTKAVARRTPAAPPAAPGGDLLSRMKQDSGGGMENTGRDDFAIPFLKVLQQLSPQCTKGKTGYRADAAPGQIFNTVTGELIDGEEGIIFLPAAYQRRFIQWGPRGTEGAGFKKEWLPEAVNEAFAQGKELYPGSGLVVKSDDDGKYYLGGTNPKKNDLLADTRNHFGIVLTERGPMQALLSLSGSQVKKSKQLMGILAAVRANGETPPTWMSKIRITTVAESNDQGSWNGIRVEHAGLIDSVELYDAGKAFHDIIVGGGGRVDYAAGSDDEHPSGKF